ncbi:unnamed protein product, partial [Rotaria socialis]
MDTENTTDEGNQSISKGSNTAKLRMKERGRSLAMPTNTDINDPENLDYEDIDDNHSPGKLEDGQEVEQNDNPVKHIIVDTKTSENIQDEEVEMLNKPQEINNNNIINSSENDAPMAAATASDEGELDEADLEDGEIHDPSTSKQRTSLSDDQSSEQNRNRINSAIPSSPQAKVQCRFFLQGRCHWGPNCKFIHPNNESTKNSTGLSVDALAATSNEVVSPTSAIVPIPTPIAASTWISPQTAAAASQFFPNPALRGPTQSAGLPLVPPTGTESAWERGLRSAKTLREQSMRRKQQDKDFNDKKFNLTIRDALDEKDGDDNVLNIDRPSPMDYDLNNLSGTNYPDQRGYHDRYHAYNYPNTSGNSHYNNHHRTRTNNNSRNNNNNNNNNNALPPNDHSDRRSRHADDYTDSRNDNRNRKENLSTKHNKATLKKDDSSSFKRNLSQQQYASGSHHNNDVQSHFNPYSGRRGDDWHDPWDRSRNHAGGAGAGGGGSNRRPSGGVREPSYSSSSSGTSSRSRSRSRPKRRSPSVTRATKPNSTTKLSEMVKNGNEKKSNSNKKLVSPSSAAATTTTNKFLPGRQISSHTLKKAEKSSITTGSSTNNHLKDQHGKDSDINIKKPTKKENISRSDSTSSSSSSDSDANRITHRSSSSSSGSSSSENETRIKTKPGSGGGKTTVSSSSSHSTKPINRQLSSSSGGGSKNASTKSKHDSVNREASKAKDSSLTSAKKRRDNSSSTGSTNAAKKTKLTATDSQKPSSDANNEENSDSNATHLDPCTGCEMPCRKHVSYPQEILKKIDQTNMSNSVEKHHRHLCIGQSIQPSQWPKDVKDLQGNYIKELNKVLLENKDAIGYPIKLTSASIDSKIHSEQTADWYLFPDQIKLKNVHVNQIKDLVQKIFVNDQSIVKIKDKTKSIEEQLQQNSDLSVSYDNIKFERLHGLWILVCCHYQRDQRC